MGESLRVLVTRPEPQASEWVARLRARGMLATALPLIEISPAPDPAAVVVAFQALADRATEGALMVFVSPNAVARFFDCLPGAVWPAGARAACTGPGTAAALAAAGVPAAAIVAPAADAPQFDSESLWAQLAHEPWHGRHVGIARGEGGRDWLAETLRAHGAVVSFVQAYRRRPPQWDPRQLACLHEALTRPAAVRWLFSSSEGLDHLRALAADVAQGARLAQTPPTAWAQSTALASHPRIAQRARELGFGTVVELPAGFEAVVGALQGSVESAVDSEVPLPAPGEPAPSIQSRAIP